MGCVYTWHWAAVCARRITITYARAPSVNARMKVGNCKVCAAQHRGHLFLQLPASTRPLLGGGDGALFGFAGPPLGRHSLGHPPKEIDEFHSARPSENLKQKIRALFSAMTLSLAPALNSDIQVRSARTRLAAVGHRPRMSANVWRRAILWGGRGWGH